MNRLSRAPNYGVSRCRSGQLLPQCPTVTLAEAGTDAGPLWLRMSIAVVPPVLAAITAGYFALSNTFNRRAERLKNLNDIRVSNKPEWINPNYTIERIMLYELKGLYHATSPMFKWLNRFANLLLLIASLIYAGYAFIFLHIVHISHENTATLNVALIVIAGVVAVAGLVGFTLSGHKSVKQIEGFDELYDQRLAALDQRAAEAKESSSQNEEQDARESKSSTQVSAKDQQAANRTTAPQDRNQPD